MPGRELAAGAGLSYDAARQGNRVVWVHRVGRARRLDMRCCCPLELGALPKYNGFRALKKYGWYDRSLFAADSKKQIYVCEAEGRKK